MLPRGRSGALAVFVPNEVVVRSKHINMTMNVVFIHSIQSCRLGPIAQEVCHEVDTQHDCILITLEMPMHEMNAEDVLGIVANEDLGE